jgi:hypothetical protein
LTAEINSEGEFYALYCDLETLDCVSDINLGISTFLAAFRTALKRSSVTRLKNYIVPPSEFGTMAAIGDALCNLTGSLDKPLIIFFDEADCLVGPVLTSFLA